MGHFLFKQPSLQKMSRLLIGPLRSPMNHDTQLFNYEYVNDNAALTVIN